MPVGKNVRSHMAHRERMKVNKYMVVSRNAVMYMDVELQYDPSNHTALKMIKKLKKANNSASS